MSADPKILPSLDDDIEADHNSWISSPDGFKLQIGLKKVTSSVTGDGSTVTVVTTANHGFSNGDSAIISGVDPSGFNGTFTITVVDATTFTYSDSTSGTATTQGTVELDHEKELLIDNEDFLLIQ